MAGWTVADMPAQTGKYFVITGATGGLGFETALALAGADGEVLLTGRDPGRGAAAVERIRAAHPDANVRFALCDVASLASVNAFADALIAEGRPIDVLINNAGVVAVPRREVTVDGFELQLGTNVIGHFLLTARLLPLLRASPAPRTVQLASLAHRNGRLFINDLNAEERYHPWQRYQQSKLAMLMFALELQRRSNAQGWGLTSVAAHPGFAWTGLLRNESNRGLQKILKAMLIRPFCQSARKGAWPILMAATDPDVERGGYYGPTGFLEARGKAGKAQIGARAHNPALAARLWRTLARMSGAEWPSKL